MTHSPSLFPLAEAATLEGWCPSNAGVDAFRALDAEDVVWSVNRQLGLLKPGIGERASRCGVSPRGVASRALCFNALTTETPELDSELCASATRL